jgi:thioredoxin reductase
MRTGDVDVAVIGGGPGGLAAALAANREGARVLLVEREARLGGILKQCIHDGFGLLHFGERLSGPEYALRWIGDLAASGVETRLLSFASRIRAVSQGFELTLSGSCGMEQITARALILSTGCRERTARQVAIHGTRPAGVLTAGQAQYYTNILGQLPCRRCVILGSGDIGLIMARRLTLEGAEVLGVYEAKPSPSGLSRNIVQCLHDFGIPLHTSRTVSQVFGHERLEGVEIVQTDKALEPIPGTEERIPCDGLILSVGLIPENELAQSLGVPLHPATKGPVCDQRGMTAIPGVFSCGNALLVNDLVDYVSQGGGIAGKNAARFALEQGNSAGANQGRGERRLADITWDANFLCLTPQRFDLDYPEPETTLFFRSQEERGLTLVRASAGGREIFRKKYRQLKPPEMERIQADFSKAGLEQGAAVSFTMEAL